MDFRVVLLERWTGQSNRLTHTTRLALASGATVLRHPSQTLSMSSTPLCPPFNSTIPLRHLLPLPSPIIPNTDLPPLHPEAKTKTIVVLPPNLILTSWSTWRPNLQRSSGLATKRAQS
jgi:hypothetical protein